MGFNVERGVGEMLEDFGHRTESIMTHVWWLSHLPRSKGRTDGKLNNWWAYVADFVQYPESKE